MTMPITADVGPSFDRTPSETKALSYVPQIKDAHSKVMAAERNGYKQGLDHAIACGKLLTDAKEVVGHGKWKEWRETHIPDLPQTTASLYMPLPRMRTSSGSQTARLATRC
jgi:DUF3102 family protein